MRRHVTRTGRMAITLTLCAGLAIAGAIAAMMSTADSQLVVATSAVIEDNYLAVLFFSVLMGLAIGYAPAEGRGTGHREGSRNAGTGGRIESCGCCYRSRWR